MEIKSSTVRRWSNDGYWDLFCEWIAIHDWRRTCMGHCTGTNPDKFRAGIDETIQFQLGFPGGAVASCLSTYTMNNLDRFFLNGDKGFAELQPATGYGPIKGRTHKGELTQPHITHQTVQMEEMSDILLKNKVPIVPVDGEEAVRDLKIIDAIYMAARTGERVGLRP